MFLRGTCNTLFVLHVSTESPEEDEEEGKAGEHDAHGENGNTVAVRICILEHLGFAEPCAQRQITGSYFIRFTNLPSLEIAGQSIGLVCCQPWNADRVYQIYCITIVESDPVVFFMECICGCILDYIIPDFRNGE